ncbi:MAG: hypothetical protein M3291_03500 [Actinomycetota bacterium]|nr:hypothetical protein [Actinomycetota bacterium]
MTKPAVPAAAGPPAVEEALFEERSPLLADLGDQANVRLAVAAELDVGSASEQDFRRRRDPRGF